MEKKQSFRDWFESNGDELLKGWLRAKEDGNEETFSGYTIGEYDYYVSVPHEDIEDDSYEIPYHGLCDKPSTIENLIYQG